MAILYIIVSLIHSSLYVLFCKSLVVQLLSHVLFFAITWTAARQASLSIIISRSSLKLKSSESVMLSHPYHMCSLLPLPSIFPNIRVFSNESALCIRWPKYWSFGISEYAELISFRFDWLISLLSEGLSRVFSSTTVQRHQ